MIRFSRLLLAAAMIAGTVSPFSAKAGGAPQDVVQAKILGGWVTENGTRMAALHLRLLPGWKTYWRAPGDSGIPPSFSWKGSKNLGGVQYHWPSPEVFTTYGMRSIGYKDELVLPIELHPRHPGQPIVIRGRMDLGVCETICMPAHLTFKAELSGLGASDPTIHDALAQRPVPGSRAGVSSVDCELEPISDGLALQATIRMPRLQGEEVALVEAGDPHIWVSEPDAHRAGNALRVTADLVPPTGRPMALDRSALRFTVIGANHAVDIQGCTTN
ncbi:protein-disulfide reductase DsbD domain-containing protein [Aliiruegeria haliotis]|nr:protein-disulfide reductase DsbD domain-containing protein [Aliiruegeria haliotis]